MFVLFFFLQTVDSFTFFRCLELCSRRWLRRTLPAVRVRQLRLGAGLRRNPARLRHHPDGRLPSVDDFRRHLHPRHHPLHSAVSSLHLCRSLLRLYHLRRATSHLLWVGRVPSVPKTVTRHFTDEPTRGQSSRRLVNSPTSNFLNINELLQNICALNVAINLNPIEYDSVQIA